jgi:predicted O-methyltransferase YrrM
MMGTLVRRLAKLRNTISLQTFPHDLHLLHKCSCKTNMFFGMNHDFIRTCIILKLLETLAVDAFVETGTHLGRTCLLVACQTNLAIFSSEVNQEYMRVARWLLKCFGSRIHLSNMDSVRFLNGLLAREQFRRPLFYLDAHWYSNLPLIEELCTILGSAESFVVVIDDFRVPGDANFGFDRYGKTVLEWELIQQVLADSGRGLAAYLPAYPSSLEVGDRRGWILIASLDNERCISEAVPIDLLQIHAVINGATSRRPLRSTADC